MEKLVVTKLHLDAILPTRKHEQDAGLDFYALLPTIVKKGEVKVVRTGIAIRISTGWFGLLASKSRHDYLIGAGIVDAGYQGEILFKVVNTSGDDISFLPGQPIGQLVLIPVATPDIHFVVFDKFYEETTERGISGGINRS